MPTLPSLVVVPVALRNRCASCVLHQAGACALYATSGEASECVACSARIDHLLTLLEHFCTNHPSGLSRAETDQLCTAYNGLRTSLEALRLKETPR